MYIFTLYFVMQVINKIVDPELTLNRTLLQMPLQCGSKPLSYFWRMIFQVIMHPLNEKSCHILTRTPYFLLTTLMARDTEWRNTNTYRDVAPHDSTCTHLMEQTWLLCSALAFAHRIQDCGSMDTEICSQGWPM